MKDVNLNVRISSVLRDQFEIIIEEVKLSKSKAIRNALDQYIYINGKTKPALIWCFNELEFLLEKLDDSDINELKTQLRILSSKYQSRWDMKREFIKLLPAVYNEELCNAQNFKPTYYLHIDYVKEQLGLKLVRHSCNISLSRNRVLIETNRDIKQLAVGSWQLAVEPPATCYPVPFLQDPHIPCPE